MLARSRCEPLSIVLSTNLTTLSSLAAAVTSAIDYKLTFAKTYNSAAESEEATSECHKRSAKRVLKGLLANGGAFCSSPATPGSLSALPHSRHIHQAWTAHSGTVSNAVSESPATT